MCLHVSFRFTSVSGQCFWQGSWYGSAPLSSPNRLSLLPSLSPNVATTPSTSCCSPQYSVTTSTFSSPIPPGASLRSNSLLGIGFNNILTFFATSHAPASLLCSGHLRSHDNSESALTAHSLRLQQRQSEAQVSHLAGRFRGQLRSTALPRSAIDQLRRRHPRPKAHYHLTIHRNRLQQ